MARGLRRVWFVIEVKTKDGDYEDVAKVKSLGLAEIVKERFKELYEEVRIK